MRKTILSFVLIVFMSFINFFIWPEDIFTDNSELKINKIKANASTVGLYELFEINIDLSATYNNPFDPEQIELLAHFISPTKKKIIIPGFFYQEFDRQCTKEGKEYLNALNRFSWKVRFAPKEIGSYKYYITLKDKNGERSTEEKKFSVKNSNNEGFVSVDKESVYYMKHDSGKPYFAVGVSIAWTSWEGQTCEIDYYFDKLAKSSCNYSRIWMAEWNLVLEWMNYHRTKGKAHGLGKYSLDNSWRIDHIIEQARKKGIYLLLTMDTYGSIMSEKGFWGEERWHVNPYNIKNGGPCKTPDDFWTNEEAKKIYKRRLRYILSRWGYSTALLAYEFWNEVNGPGKWTEEMSRYIKENDPYGHLVTTSIGYPFDKKHLYDESQIWELENIDYTQTHLYGDKGSIRDIAKAINRNITEMTGKYNKPHILAEFGLDFGADDLEYDKKGQGTHLHNSIWASVMSRSFGIPITHWKEYIDEKDLYYQFSAVSNFVKDIDWLDGKWEIAEVNNLRTGSSKSEYSDLILDCPGNWGEKGGEEITISKEGKVTGKINQFVHGLQKKDLRTTPVFKVDYPEKGKFILLVGSVAQSALIKVYLDGKQVWKHSFIPGPGEGEWKRSSLDERYQVYIADYDKKYEMDIPKGKHEIRIENNGKDWLRIKNIILTNYRDKNIPFIRVLGLSNKNQTILWIQDKKSNWENIYKNADLQELESITFDLGGLKKGNYEIEWWDTNEGIIIKKEKKISLNGILKIDVPSFKGDIACKITNLRK